MTNSTPTDDFETVASYFDGGGQYLAEVSADRTRMRFTIGAETAEPEVYLSELYPIDRPELAEIDWAEWTLSDRFASTPDWTLMDEHDVVRIDGIVYGARQLDEDDDALAEPNVPVAIRAALPDGFSLDDLAESIRDSFGRAANDGRESGVLRDANGNRIGGWDSGALVEDDLDSRIRSHRDELVAYVEQSADAPASIDDAVETLVRLVVAVVR